MGSKRDAVETLWQRELYTFGNEPDLKYCGVDEAQKKFNGPQQGLAGL